MSIRTKADLEKRIAALGGISDEQKRSVVCSLIGHSHVIDMCFGYVSCARCNAQIGDTLAGAFDTTGHVVVGHRAEGAPCSTCLANYKKLRWQDKVFLPEKKLAEMLQGLDIKPRAVKKPERANRRKR